MSEFKNKKTGEIITRQKLVDLAIVEAVARYEKNGKKVWQDLSSSQMIGNIRNQFQRKIRKEKWVNVIEYPPAYYN